MELLHFAYYARKNCVGEGERVSAKEIKNKKLEQSETVKTRVFGKEENAVFRPFLYSLHSLKLRKT